MRILALSASLRRGSLNRRLLELAARIASDLGSAVELPDFRELSMPLYDGDLEADAGLPRGAQALVAHLHWADAVMIASPEYNYSISGVLKNTIDWVSRARPMPWRGKSIYLMSASPSAMGGVRGLWQTRIPLEGCGAVVFPDMFALARAHDAFAPSGALKDESLAERLEREVVGFVRFAEGLSPICNRPPSAEAERKKRQIEAALEDESQIQPSPLPEARAAP